MEVHPIEDTHVAQPQVQTGIANACPYCLSPVEITLTQKGRAICPICRQVFEIVGDETRTYVEMQARHVGRFALLERLGEGSFGVVWQARDTQLDRIVAVKIPRKNDLDFAEAERFFHEARAVARLHHPNIVSVFDVGREGSLLYIVSDFVAGGTLADRMATRRVTPLDAARLCLKLAEALHYAHERGIVHRDLKPGNVLIDGQGEPMITDFGLAKRDSVDATMTVEGQVLGTPAYMAPEQARGEAHHADRRSDVYSLGVMLFQMLTGELPFRGSLQMLIMQIVRDEPPRPRKLNTHIPADLETITLKCLQKEPKRRYQTAQELADDLRAFLERKPIRARPIGRGERWWRWCRRNPANASLGAAVSGLLILLTIGSVVFGFRQQRLRIEADEAQRETARSLAESRQRLIAMQVADGVRLMDDGDLFGSAVWFAEALVLDDNENRRAEHQLRLGLTLGQAPQLEQMWTHPWPLTHVEFSPDGKFGLTAGGDDLAHQGAAHIWDLVSGREIGKPRRHTGAVQYACFSPAGERVATCGSDHRARLWDTLTGDPVGDWPHERAVNGVAFNASGTRMVTSSGDLFGEESFGEVRVFDTARGALCLGPLRLEAPASMAVFSPDGTWIVGACGFTFRGNRAGYAQLWKSENGEPGPRLIHAGNVTCASFAPNGEFVATASEDGTARIWQTTDGAAVTPPLPHGNHVTSVAFTAGSDRLLTTSRDGAARLWALPGGNLIHASARHAGTIRHAQFSGDGLRFATASSDRTARVWETSTGEPVSAPLRSGGKVIRAAVEPGGTAVLAASVDGTARLWRLPANGGAARVFQLDGEPLTAEFSRDGARLLLATQQGDVRLCSLPEWSVASLRKNQELLGSAAISPDGRLVAVGLLDGAILLLDAATREARREDFRESSPAVHLEFSPDAVRLASAHKDGVGRIWNLGQSSGHHPTLLHTDAVQWICFSPDGSRVATSSRDSKVRLWESATGDLIGQPLDHATAVNAVCFSPDGQKLASCTLDFSLRQCAGHLWDVATGKASGPLLPHNDGVEYITFSQDGRLVATASEDGTARVWNVRSGLPAARSLPHRSHVTRVVFSPDGRCLATTSRDRTARLWDVATGEPLSPPLPHPAAVSRAAFSPSGTTLVTACANGNVAAWDIVAANGAPDRLRALAQLLASHRIDSTAGLSPLTASEAGTLWEAAGATK